MGTLDGKSIVVTGASSGIGRAIATRFVAEGALVTAGSRTDPELDGVRWIRTDVRMAREVEALVDAAVVAHGWVDVLVNNAGVQLEKTVAETTDDDFDAVMDVNVRGVFNGCRAAVRSMRRSGGGVIVNVGSTAADHADAGLAVYNASKGAVHSLTRAVAVDHGADGIRCVAIAPGWVATALADAAFDAMPNPESARSDAVGRHPVGRLGVPEDVAALAVWLASDEAAFASGSVFTLDGGLTAQNPMGW